MKSGSMTWAIGLLLAFSCSNLLVHASDRLVEKPLVLGSNGLAASNVSAPKHIAGYFKLNRTMDAHMFYFYFESRSQKPDDPLVLWMTGGPGCSSELAVFYENGPYHIKKDLTLEDAEYGWDVSHNMIFVDQPINTGFSYSDDERDTVHDEVGVANDMLDFLGEFLEAHPELKGRDFFVTGESYAGHYVPAVTSAVYLAGKAGTAPDIQLKGMAVGNGLTAPGIQYGAYADFALQNDLITEFERNAIMLAYPACRLGIELCNGASWSSECELALTFCQSTMFDSIMAIAGNINVYDIRKQCEGPLCYDFSLLDKFLNQESIREALGVGDREWQSCSPEVYMDMLGDWMKSYSALIPPMLEDGVKVMIYAGVEDFICNWLGNSRWVDALEWSGSSSWEKAPTRDWKVDGELAGSVRSYGPLSFVKVNLAGHMVPMDQPKNALAMLTGFTRNKPLAAGPLLLNPTERQEVLLQSSSVTV